MTGQQLLSGCIAETAVHALDIASATSTDLTLDPSLAETALAIAAQLAPTLAAHGFTAPSLNISEAASTKARLLAVFGRQP